MNKKIVSILTLLIIVLSTGITYAWLTWTSTNTNVTFTIQGITITYNAGDTITGNLIPTSSKNISGNIIKEITIQSNTIVSTFNLYLDLTTFPTALAEPSLKWEIYKEDILYNSGNFDNEVQGNTITLLDNERATTVLDTYTLYIWIDGTNYNNPTAMQGKTFSFNLNADATNEPDSSSSATTLTSTTGNISITNGTESRLNNYLIYGKSIQDTVTYGNPSPTNPVDVVSLGEEGTINVITSGKNLISSYFSSNFTSGGITWHVNGENIIANGTSNVVEAQFEIVDRSQLYQLDAGSYTLSGCPEGGSSTKYAIALDAYTYVNEHLNI